MSFFIKAKLKDLTVLSPYGKIVF